ncbi:MAG: asparagine synthase (glutamine-hydrolyzing) [Cetobacterium sp.]
MCGICGFISKERVSKNDLKKMNDAIAYRGPDSQGYSLDEINETRIGLAHRRLAIMDLSPLGHQPMYSNDKNIVVIFNGEIYNFKDIKKDLEKRGYIFSSNSDTEVIVKGYEEYGIDIIQKLNGMFAISILDKKNKELYLIRDHLGVKPLYFYKKNENLIFGSELKAIMEYPHFIKEIDENVLDTYLYHGYITGDKSIFKNTYKLLPGHYLKYKNGEITIKNYWSIKKSFENREVKSFSENEWKEKIKSHLESSIKDRMISDVPIGAFLSGGIDSTLIVSIMQKLSKVPIKTFTIGFEDQKYNEANEAKKIAEYLGTDHTEHYITLENVKEIIENIPKYYDEPFADSSQIPTMLVSKLARKKVTVSLSGDGGDELFCGYSSYDHYLSLEKYKKLSKILNYIPKKKKVIKVINNKYTHAFYFNNTNNIINAGYLNYLNKESLIKNLKNKKRENNYFKLNELTDQTQEKGMLRDLITYLPDDVLTKVDRASMTFSLESRAPYVDDYKFVELSFNIPHFLKYKNGEKKYILKEVLYDYVPKEMMQRPKKGFEIPINKWLKNELKYLLDEFLGDKFIKSQNIFDENEIKKCLNLFFKNENKEFKGVYVNKLIWNLLIFQMWYKRYII